MSARLSRRKATNTIMMGLASGAACIGLLVLALILIHLLIQGFRALGPSLFTQDTPGPMEAGGLRNAILGSLIMSGIAMVIGIPIGILAGTYMAEYGRFSPITKVIRFTNEILLSVPSIITGLFVYQLLVVNMGHFSGLAGAVALAMLLIPTVVHTTEDMLRLVPDQMREAGLALGISRAALIRHIIYRSALTGLVTGVLLAIARISGETAPLLFTALSNNFFSTNILQPLSSLQITVYQFALSPYENWQSLAWAGALLITIAVLGLSIVARLITRRRDL